MKDPIPDLVENLRWALEQLPPSTHRDAIQANYDRITAELRPTSIPASPGEQQRQGGEVP